MTYVRILKKKSLQKQIQQECSEVPWLNQQFHD